MGIFDLPSFFSLPVLAVIALLLVLASARTVPQGNVAVTVIFGKYRRVLRPGLRFVIPLLEKIKTRISIQNRASELEFQAISQDQAQVQFTAMLLYAVMDDREETIKNVAFKFISEQEFTTTLIRTVEGSTRGFVATKKQSEILGLRSEIVSEVKDQLDNTLAGWGYHLIDVQLNDIRFDTRITESMSQVVASQNLLAAATNEGDALRIRRTKEAEAEGAAITIAAEAEKLAAQLRGEGVSLFRAEVSQGLTDAAAKMREAGVDESLILFSIWTEALRHIAENGSGNVLFLDGSPQGMDATMRKLMAMDQLGQIGPSKMN